MDISQLRRSADPAARIEPGALASGRLAVSTGPDILSGEPIGSTLRSPVAAAILVAGAVHVPLVSEHLHEAPYIGVLFLALAAACTVLALLLARRDSAAIWAATTVLAAGTALAYVASRTVGLPQIHDDVGNWSDPLGAVALTTETVAAAIGTFVLNCHRRHRRFQQPVNTGDRSLKGKDPHR